MGRFTKQTNLKSWRKLAVHAWRDAGDPSVYGIVDIDVTNALAFIDDVRSRTGVKITLTHVVGKAIALAIAERPEVNAIIRRGKYIYLRDTIDVFFQVAFDGGEDLSGCKVVGADKKTVETIASELQSKAALVRTNQDKELLRTQKLMNALPTTMRGWMLKGTSYLTYDLGLDLRAAGIPYDQFGSVMVTNVGMFGLPMGFAPLVPFSKTPILLTVGAVQDKPLAVDGQVVVRPVLTIGATFDHRLLDGYQAGHLARRFRSAMADPSTEFVREPVMARAP